MGLRRNRSSGTRLESVKEYTDTYTQHDPSEYASSAMVQTDTPIVPSTASSSTQTSPPRNVKPIMADASMQTDIVISLTTHDSIDDDDDDDDDDSSSTSTLTVVTPSPSPSPLKRRTPIMLLGSSDLPPSYARLEAEEREKIGQEYLRKWHPGMSPATSSTLMSGSSMSNTSARLPVVSREAVEEWKNLKRELGFECLAIDKVLLSGHEQSSPTAPTSSDTEAAVSTMTPRLAREWASKVKAAAEAEEEGNTEVAARPKRRSPRRNFYKLYNDAFYPDAEGHDAPRRNWNVILTGLGMWAVALMTGKPHYYLLYLLSYLTLTFFSCCSSSDEVRLQRGDV